jgi:hypothetical protein
MKPFLLIAGAGYYPDYGTRDWKGCFRSYEEALAAVTIIEGEDILFVQGPRKGQVKDKGRNKYVVNGEDHDWYEIIDLREWMELRCSHES